MNTIANNAHIYNKLHLFKLNNRIPNTIFYGSVLSKKEHILVKFLKDIYKNDIVFNENTMFVNCAHCKGIKFIREELKFFAKTNAQPGVEFKSIILLNADHLTIDAQSALRRCIEQFSDNTRFFIVVENKNKLLNPILSRFCEIYVPDTDETNIVMNISYIQDIDHFLTPYKNREKQVSHNDILSTTNRLYNEAFSCLDILQWIKKQNIWTEFEKANIGMFYSKIRAEYRSEQLLMFTLLSFICFDVQCNINTKSFM